MRILSGPECPDDTEPICPKRPCHKHRVNRCQRIDPLILFANAADRRAKHEKRRWPEKRCEIPATLHAPLPFPLFRASLCFLWPNPSAVRPMATRNWRKRTKMGPGGRRSCSPWGLPEWRWIFRPLVGGQACRRPKASCRPVVVVKVRRPRRPTGMSSAQSPGMAARRASLVRWGDAGEGATAGRLRCLQPFFKRPGAWPGSRQRAMGKKGEIILLTQICPWLYSVIVEREGSTCQAIFRTKLLSIFETDGRTLER